MFVSGCSPLTGWVQSLSSQVSELAFLPSIAHSPRRNYHQVLVLPRLCQICSHPWPIQEDRVAFVHLHEVNSAKPELSTELRGTSGVTQVRDEDEGKV